MKYKIVSASGHHLHAFGSNEPLVFQTKQAAEDALKKYLGDHYYTDREAYDIIKLVPYFKVTYDFI